MSVSNLQGLLPGAALRLPLNPAPSGVMRCCDWHLTQCAHCPAAPVCIKGQFGISVNQGNNAKIKVEGSGIQVENGKAGQEVDVFLPGFIIPSLRNFSLT